MSSLMEFYNNQYRQGAMSMPLRPLSKCRWP